MKHPRLIEIKINTEDAYVYFSNNRIRSRNRGSKYIIKTRTESKIVLEKEKEDN